jgi:phosphoribosylformylglycinamidine (FGAM) synthase-like enzyme
LYEYFFGEDQARYIIEIETNDLVKTEKILKENNVYFENIGFTQKEFFEVDNELKIKTNELFKINNEWYNNY